MLGTPFIHERKTSEALLNCGFITTEDIAIKRGEIFRWFMEMLMLGVGVGSDMQGVGKIPLAKPVGNPFTFVIEDTRESWAKSVAVLFNSYVYDHAPVIFDYSQIRPAGEPIKGFGGISSGPAPLELLHSRMRTFLDANPGPITTRTLADIFNAIGACVVSGNVRRSAEILLGDPNDQEFLDLKNYSVSPERAGVAWASNNSVLGTVGMNYDNIASRVLTNGEPGVIWMENAQQFARWGDNRSDNAVGINPCGEQPLASTEMCLLAEIYMNNHDSLEDFYKTIEIAYLYAKTISLTYSWIKDEESRNIMCANRRIGLSTTGVAQFLGKHGENKLQQFWDRGYEYVYQLDVMYSSWLGIPYSIRNTSIKPSGSVSLIAGATPGIHYPHSQYYIRRVRLQENTKLVKVLQKAGIPIEQDVYSANTVVAEFPIYAGKVKGINDISLLEQQDLAIAAQRYWADNSVSVTLTFDPTTTTEKEIQHALMRAERGLKAVSLLPDVSKGAYAQMPYETIDGDEYERRIQKIDFTMFDDLSYYMNMHDKILDKYCNNDTCEV